MQHVTGFQLPHAVGDTPMGPFKVKEMAAPPTHFNPHALHLKDGTATGVYVLYSNGGGFEQQAAGGDSADGIPKCNGAEVDGKHTPAPFTQPAGSCNTSLCAIYATSLDGPWSMKSVESVCTNNFVTWQLKNGSILAGGTCGDMTFPNGTDMTGNDGERIWLGIAAPGNWAGPFVTVVSDSRISHPGAFKTSHNGMRNNDVAAGIFTWERCACDHFVVSRSLAMGSTAHCGTSTSPARTLRCGKSES